MYQTAQYGSMTIIHLIPVAQSLVCGNNRVVASEATISAKKSIPESAKSETLMRVVAN